MPHSRSTGPVGRDGEQRAGDVAVGDQAHARAGGADRLDALLVARAVEHDDHHVAHVGALALGDQLDGLAERAVEVEQVGDARRRRPSSPCRRTGPGRTSCRARTARSPPARSACPSAASRVPSSGSTAMSTARRRAVADVLAVVEHRRLVLLALADHDDAVHVDRVQHVRACRRRRPGRRPPCRPCRPAAPPAARRPRSRARARARGCGRAWRLGVMLTALPEACATRSVSLARMRAADDHQDRAEQRAAPDPSSRRDLAAAARRGAVDEPRVERPGRSAAIATTRGQLAARPRAARGRGSTIQARMNGATRGGRAAASASAVCDLPAAERAAARRRSRAFGLSGSVSYHGRNRQTPRSERRRAMRDELSPSQAAEVHARRGAYRVPHARAALGPDHPVRRRPARRARDRCCARRGARLRRPVDRRDDRRRRLHAAGAGRRLDRADAARHRRRQPVHARAGACSPSTRRRSHDASRRALRARARRRRRT